ncbi:anaphase-promoting complex subunit 4-like isoform X2 [Ptychodera flava]|uniref:anaphase-promoting complex subunit 4-like isoform X2 n=1 Tax=Ptychodera flava TaxID=63121 RepID=UPI003969D8BA
MHSAFRQLEEKHLSAEVVKMLWSPRMDLIALANIHGEVLLHRLSWQRVWVLPVTTNETSKKVTALAWRPDGKALAVGYGSGQLLICDVENAEVLHTSSLNTAISCMQWTDVSEKLLGESVRLDFEDSASTYLPRFPAPSKSALSKIYKEDNAEDAKKLDGQERLNILVVGCDGSNVHLLAFGICPIVVIDLSKITDTQVSRVVGASLSRDLKSLHMVVEQAAEMPASTGSENKYDVNFITYGTPVLADRHQEIALFALKYGTITTLTEYLNNTLKAMSEAYEDILLEMESKLAKYAETKFTPGTVSDDFLQLLMWGKCSQELQSFLLHELSEKGLKKMGLSVESSYTNIQKLVIKHVHSIGKALLYHLSEVKGMSLWFEKYAVIGLSTTQIEGAMTAVGSFILKANELLQVIEISLQNFKAFFRWIYVIILRLSEETIPPEISKMTQKDVTFVAEFLKENLQNDKESIKKGSGFSLERVGQYLKREDLSFPQEVLENPWQQFVDSCPNLRDSKLLFRHHANKSLYQLFDALEQEVKSVLSKPATVIGEGLKKEESSYLLYQTVCHQDDKKIFTPAITQQTMEESGTLYTILTTEKSPTDKVYMIRKSTQSDSVASVLEVCFGMLGESSANDSTVSYRCMQHKVLDVQFYDEATLSVLLHEDSSDGDNFSVLAHLPVSSFTEKSYQPLAGCKPQLLGAKVLQTNDLGPSVSQYRRLQNMKASYFAVSGNRRVSCVMFSSGRRVRVFDMDAEDEGGGDVDDNDDDDEDDKDSKDSENMDS